MKYIGLILCGIAMFLFSIMGGVVGLWVSELVKFIKTRKNKNGDSKNHEEK